MQQNKVGISWLTTNWSGICEQLRSISKPTLVIAGNDDVVPVANSLVIAAKIPGAWLVQIKGAGHDLMFQYPDKFNKVLQTFLSTFPYSLLLLGDTRNAIQQQGQNTPLW
jgi:pimeloyl-ACP methyl ester carboxylesterase